MHSILAEVDKGDPLIGLGDWVLIELHGDLTKFDEIENITWKNVRYNDNGQPLLQIGKYIVQGIEKKLAKPMHIMKKRESAELSNLYSMMMIKDDEILGFETEYNATDVFLKGFCDKRLIFSLMNNEILVDDATNVTLHSN